MTTAWVTSYPPYKLRANCESTAGQAPPYRLRTTNNVQGGLRIHPTDYKLALTGTAGSARPTIFFSRTWKTQKEASMKIGVMVESFRKGLDGGLQAAVDLGAAGVQMYAVRGETHPDNLNTEQRKELLRKVKGMGLEFSAICADFGHGFGDAAANVKLIEESKKVVDLTVDLECAVVTTHIGAVPADPSHACYGAMLEACGQLARYGASMGATFAVETGPEPATVLRAFLDEIGEPKGLGVNFDPANLVMLLREDIPTAVGLLGPYIVHTHAKDGVNLKRITAPLLFDAYAGKAPAGFNWGDYMRETPLGEGDVDFPTYLPALQEAGFDGYLTIEREVGDNPQQDIENAVRFLQELLSE